MHSIYVYTDIYQGLKILANSYIYIYICIFGGKVLGELRGLGWDGGVGISVSFGLLLR